MECTAQRTSTNVYIHATISLIKIQSIFTTKKVTSNPLVGIPCTVLRLHTFTAKGQSLIPGQGTKFPQIMQHGQNQKQ